MIYFFAHLNIIIREVGIYTGGYSFEAQFAVKFLNKSMTPYFETKGSILGFEFTKMHGGSGSKVLGRIGLGSYSE